MPVQRFFHAIPDPTLLNARLRNTLVESRSLSLTLLHYASPSLLQQRVIIRKFKCFWYRHRKRERGRARGREDSQRGRAKETLPSSAASSSSSARSPLTSLRHRSTAFLVLRGVTFPLSLPRAESRSPALLARRKVSQVVSRFAIAPRGWAPCDTFARRKQPRDFIEIDRNK